MIGCSRKKVGGGHRNQSVRQRPLSAAVSPFHGRFRHALAQRLVSGNQERTGKEETMIISASRRTDIPAFYSGWLLRRLAEGYALVRNPMRPHQVSRVSLLPEAVSGLVLWTKNAAPMLDKLGLLRPYAYCFQYTLNAYGGDMEPGLPALETRIETFRALACQIGQQRVIWRYDPVALNPRYGTQYHVDAFGYIAHHLRDCTECCTISFLDFYQKTARATKRLGIRPAADEEKAEIARGFTRIAREYGLRLTACAEDVSYPGIERAACIDTQLLGRIGGVPVPYRKDKNQRPACGCAESVDIGAYDTCAYRCAYCYANRPGMSAAHCDTASPLLCSVPGEGDVIRERTLRRRS